MDPKSKTVLFLCSVLLISSYYFLLPFARGKILEMHTRKLKRRFNQMLSNGGSIDKLRMLKTLINNVRHCRDHNVPLDGTLEEVKKAYDELVITDEKVFLKLSHTYNIAIFIPVFFPMIVQSFGLLRDRK